MFLLWSLKKLIFFVQSKMPQNTLRQKALRKLTTPDGLGQVAIMLGMTALVGSIMGELIATILTYLLGFGGRHIPTWSSILFMSTTALYFMRIVVLSQIEAEERKLEEEQKHREGIEKLFGPKGIALKRDNH